MLSGNVTIEAVAYELPPNRIKSSDIEDQFEKTLERLGIKKGQLEALTGIRERRFWDRGVMPSDVASLAARKVIDIAGIDQNEIGCIINTSVCKDYIEPSVASLVHGNLKLPCTCINFDIGNACLGFLNGMFAISLMIESGLIKYGMIVDGEGSREIVEATIKKLQEPCASHNTFRDNFASLTLGSGAVAMILCHKDYSRTNHIINGTVTLSDTKYNRLCLGQKDYMQADAFGILIHGIELAHLTWKLAEKTFDRWSDEQISIYIPHQVSSRNMDALNKKLGLNPEKPYVNFYTLGNIGPAALPITLAMAADEDGRIKTFDHVGLLGIGSGLNCSMMSVTW